MMSETQGTRHTAGRWLSERILEWLDGSNEPIAIHAGHFMLLASGEQCWPGVLEELEPGDTDMRNSIAAVIAHFPMQTWRLGLDIVRALQPTGKQVGITTLVNDWYFLRHREVGEATALRAQFYRMNTGPLKSYREELRKCSLESSVIRQVGPHRAFVSEYWLRRRSERRLKKLGATKRGAELGLRWEFGARGERELIWDTLGRECRLLLCGQADCAEEMMEFLYMLERAGFRRLVNLVPLECEGPVNVGCERAMALFELDDMAVLNVSLACLGAGNGRDGDWTEARVHRIFGERVAADLVEPNIESSYWRA